MRIEPQRKLFVGVRIDNRLRDALGTAAPRDRAFFDGTDPRYLTILRSADDSYVGKLVDSGISAVSMDDLKRNIQSLMSKLGGRRADDDVKVFACDDGDPAPRPDPVERPQY